jgi:sugar phosphate isomerase/epimerase
MTSILANSANDRPSAAAATGRVDRRGFLAALCAVFATAADTARAVRLARIGVQMRSLGLAVASNPGPGLLAAAALGYREIEVWAPEGTLPDVRAIRAGLNQFGLTAPSRHVQMSDLLSNGRRVLIECQLLGSRHIVCSEVPFQQRQSLDGYARVAELLNAAGRLTASVDIQLAVHPHRDDFIGRAGGVIPYDFLLRNTDPRLVKMQLDAALLTLLNRDPVTELAQHPGRFPTIHVNDVQPAPGEMPAALGTGRVDFPALLAAATGAGVQHYFVQDLRTGDPAAQLKADFAYLSALEF